jgi:outer membrane lipoprotein-sorting protein
MIFVLFLISSQLTEVSEKLARVKSLECKFDEILLVQGDTMKFTGSVYAVKDKARIDVYKPEREIMIFEGDSVFVWREQNGQVFRRQTPIIFYSVLFSPSENYRVDSTSSKWMHLSPLKSELDYPISVRLNKDYLPEKIKFVQESGIGMFTFGSYKLNKTYPEDFFSLNSVKGSLGEFFYQR